MTEANVYRDREKKDQLLMSVRVKCAGEASMALLLFFVSLLWLLAYSFTTAFISDLVIFTSEFS